jgi:branched-chain amino acid transport system substrate-binding protein
MSYRISITKVAISLIILFSLLFSHHVQAAEPIKIGVSYAFSGPMAINPVGIVKGHELAVAEINESGGILGRQVKLIVKDDAGKPENTTRNCKEFAIKDEVDWTVSGYGTSVGLAAEAIAGQFKVPTFVFGGHSEVITDKDLNEYTFRFAPTTRSEGGMCAKVLAEEVFKGVKNPTIYWISWDYEYGHSLYRPFVPEIKKLRPDVKIVGEAWPRTGETDYGPFINQMLALKPTVIVNAVWGGGVVTLFKQCNQMGIFERSKVISMALIAGNEYRKAIGLNMPEGTWSNAYDDEVWPMNDEQKDFYRKYRDFFNVKADEMVPSHARPGYEVIYMIKQAIDKAGSTDKVKMCKAMETVSLDSYRGKLKIRAFDHQVINTNLWAPMIKVPGKQILQLDPKRAVSVSIEEYVYPFDKWLEIRKKAGKGKLWE